MKSGSELTVQTLSGPVVKGLAAELPASDPSGVLAIQNEHYGYDSPGSDWIALNSSIAVELGWSSVADGLCRWVDDDGLAMAESFWWTDGNVEFDQAGYGSHQVGSGWAVFTSERAFRRIKGWYGPPSRRSIVVRESQRQSDFVDNAVSIVRPIEAASDEVEDRIELRIIDHGTL